MQTNRRDVNELTHTTRRVFCTDVVLTSAALLLAPAAMHGASARDSLVAYPPRKIEGAERMPPGSGLYFNYPTRNDPAVLLRFSETEYRAYSRRCSHAGCSVEFDAPSRCLICPCHRGAYDARMGHVMSGPPQRPLDEITLQVRAGGHLWAVGKNSRNREIITQTLRGGELK